MTTQLRHPRTGLLALGIVGGKPVWPIMGAAEPTAEEAAATAAAAAKAQQDSVAAKAKADADAAATAAGKSDTTDWKAEARKHEARAKENADKAKQLDALTEAAKTEAEKQADALKRAEQERDEANAKSLRYEVAAESGLDPKLAKYLNGTREQMVAAAAELLAATKTTGRPGVDDSQGKGGTGGAASVQAGADLYAARHPKRT